MTKTKKQLRAEAVERLKMLDEYGGGSFEYAILGSDKIAWRYMDKRDALIDLLTDNDANDDSAPEKVVSGSEPCVTPENCRQHADQPKQAVNADRESCDSRERLEADIIDRSEQCRTILGNLRDGLNTVTVSVDVVRGWLDRQAAITKRKCMDTRINFAERVRFGSCIDELTDERDHLRRQVDMLNEQVIELTAQRDEQDDIEFVIPLENVREYVLDPPGYLKKHILEIEKQRDEYRKKLGKALDLACDIVRLGD